MTGFVCEVTPRCNLNCIFCYNSWRAPDAELPSSLEPQAFAKLLIPVLRESNARWLAFAGGEPLLYPRLDWLMQQISTALPQLQIGLLSNGVSLSKKRLSTLVRSGLTYVELSLFAASEERYQALTGSDKATGGAMLHRVHSAILAVKAFKLPLTVACTLLPEQIDEFEKIAMTAMALGADMFTINPFTPTGYGKNQQEKLLLTRKQLRQFLDAAQNIAQRLPIPITVTLPVEDCVIAHTNYPALHFSRCQCATNKWVIDPQGYLRTCEQNLERIGNLSQHSFAELSTRSEVKAFQSDNRKPECTQCSQFDQCGGGCRFRYS